MTNAPLIPGQPQAHANEPYCANCGYKLTGLTESCKCPECGRPLVEVLSRRHMMLESGKRWRSKAMIFGMPVVDIALGPKHGEMRGKARGFIAVGGVSVGVISFGGLSAGALTGLGGMAVGGLAAAGGGAIGGLAVGGGAIGCMAQGGGAVGWFARGGSAYGAHVISRSAGVVSPEAKQMFDHFAWFFGPWPPSPIGAWQPCIMLLTFTIVVAALVGLAAAWAARRDRPPGETFNMER